MATRKYVGAQLFGWIVLLAAIAGGAAYWFNLTPALEVSVEPVQRGHVEDTVPAIASGTVMLQLDSRIASDYMGTIAHVAVKEGQLVKAGEVLLNLSAAELDAQVELAKANLEAGESAMRQAELGAAISKTMTTAQVQQSVAQSDLAKRELNRLQSMLDSGAISKTEFDRASVQSRVATEATTMAKAGQRETDVRKEEIRMAGANIKQLKAGLQAAEAAREKAIVKAPFDGTVAKIFLDEGEAVTMGMPLVQLIDNSEFFVEAPFDEANAAEIKVGQKVRINLDAYRGEDFYGRVQYIAPIVQQNMDLSRTLNVKILVEEGKDKFIGGMSADVIVVIDEKDDVLYAPSDSLVRDQYAYVLEGGRAIRRDVTTGTGNWESIEILDGLNEGDVLITSVALQGLDDGVRVEVAEDSDS
jgi:HlyD family secretion protein